MRCRINSPDSRINWASRPVVAAGQGVTAHPWPLQPDAVVVRQDDAGAWRTAQIAGAAPPAQGIRADWSTMPEEVRAACERWLGSPIVRVVSQPSGFSPGVAAR